MPQKSTSQPAAEPATPDRDDARRGSVHRLQMPEAEQARQEAKPAQPNRRAGGRVVLPQRSRVLVGSWKWMTPTLVAASVLAAATSLSIPPLLAIPLLLAAIGLPYLTPRLDPPVIKGTAALQRQFVMIGGLVVAPMIAFSAAILLWLSQGGLAWTSGLSALVGASTVGSAFLYRRLNAMFSAQIGVWAMPALFYGGLIGLGGMFVLCMTAFVIIRRESELQSQLDKKLQREERDRKRAEHILRDYEETGQGWFWETDRRGQLTYVSRPVAEALGYTQETMVGRPLNDLFDLADRDDESERTLTFHISARSPFSELAVRSAIRDEERWWSVTGRPLYDTFDNFVGFRGAGTDLTEKRRSQEKATRLARYDSLTGLANRFLMSQTLEKILGAPQELNRTCAVFLLDLDRFKQVNDTLGHPVGDELLKQVSVRLEGVVGEHGQVGRLGGDEFQVILPGTHKREELGELAHRIISSLSQPYGIEDHRVVIGASVGVAIAPDDGVTSEAIIRNADLALYAAKDGGRGRFHFYANDLHSEAEARRELEQDLRDAVTHGQLELFYQPVVSAADEEIVGFEALLRWNHHVKGWMQPQKFVEIAEDCGLIEQIGEWALRTACHELSTWPENVRCAVNVSPLQFANPNFPTVVTNAVAQAGIDPSRLELEITESVFLTDDSNTDQMFAALKRVGVRLALDDFGTGYSSLGYLKKAPFDKIKIDQSFVRGATETGSRNGAIITSITSLAQALDMDTTAEGVETLDELDLIRMLGCSHIQGYIYDKPLSRDVVMKRLQAGLKATASGPRSARAARQKMLRKVELSHGATKYRGTIRNISVTGAMIEGLWNVPDNTVFDLQISETVSLKVTSRWCYEGRMGVQFDRPLERDFNGNIKVIADATPAARKSLLRDAG
ncbi:EAL domain-containing protein [Alteriqipengyuania flavescens]|uniref:EAL domain-containing protein n=1 Tax=Alteriqipengyuania flavescens TaxID=3053610 RepID=UPI0025B2E083|nr:EAL domain-containing protein [Alteriqipengyuania flavescens]WJY18080.1 EAL domain-containing protein [Alteriqipengyuania flavescens]WJY24021.1 EAL domain-containing protein [Alteriqipengyuania flavescens]